jgi:prevent-host-death family protein
MRSVALSEAKDRLSEFVAAAEAGDEIVITRHGKPRAKLVPVEDSETRRRDAIAALGKIARLRARLRAEGRTATVDELIAWKNEGRP